MPLETGTYLNDLVATNPLYNESGAQGDDHIRLIKATLKNTFPNLDGPVTRTPAQMNYPVPIGCIMVWFGATVSIPDGWARCDGGTYTRTDGGGDIVTPDLRGRTVFGMVGEAEFASGASGGNISATTGSSGAHSHTGTAASAGSHSHSGTAASAGSHSHNGSTASGGSHSHSASTGSAGSHNHGGSTGSGGNHNHGGTNETTLTVEQIPSHRHFVVHIDEVGGDVADPPMTTRPIAHRKNVGGSSSDYYLSRARNSDEADAGRSSLTGGGEAHSHSIPSSGSHSHSIGSDGSHTHSVSVSSGGSHSHDLSTDAAGAHTHSVSTAAAGAHTHSVSTNEAGAHTHSVNVLPPYRALHYIMKI